ncbi:MAG TPA: hypothetical protein DIW23_08390, partial [Anaerolineae bacterium]|nr:hypothetical protein [Anaerolineae bacterium]
CVLPHHNQFGKRWANNLRTLLPNAILIGIDEETGMINSGDNWQVYGKGEVTVYRSESTVTVGRGGKFSLIGI